MSLTSVVNGAPNGLIRSPWRQCLSVSGVSSDVMAASRYSTEASGRRGRIKSAASCSSMEILIPTCGTSTVLIRFGCISATVSPSGCGLAPPMVSMPRSSIAVFFCVPMNCNPVCLCVTAVTMLYATSATNPCGRRYSTSNIVPLSCPYRFSSAVTSRREASPKTASASSTNVRYSS